MLVDLARNDLARIATVGSRYVADLLKVDRYSSRHAFGFACRCNLARRLRCPRRVSRLHEHRHPSWRAKSQVPQPSFVRPNKVGAEVMAVRLAI